MLGILLAAEFQTPRAVAKLPLYVEERATQQVERLRHLLAVGAATRRLEVDLWFAVAMTI
jgi:hypothetical protein